MRKKAQEQRRMNPLLRYFTSYQVPQSVNYPQQGYATNFLVNARRMWGEQHPVLNRVLRDRINNSMQGLTGLYQNMDPGGQAMADQFTRQRAQQYRGQQVSLPPHVEALSDHLVDNRKIPRQAVNALIDEDRVGAAKAQALFNRQQRMRSAPKPTAITGFTKANADKASSLLKTVPFEVKSVTGQTKTRLRAEIADTPQARCKGMAKHAMVPPYGMFFDIPGPFWMKGMTFPLDVAFLSKEGRVVDIQHMPISVAPDFLKARYQSRDPSAVYALEMPVGWFKYAQVSVGDTITVADVKTWTKVAQQQPAASAPSNNSVFRPAHAIGPVGLIAGLLLARRYKASPLLNKELTRLARKYGVNVVMSKPIVEQMLPHLNFMSAKGPMAVITQYLDELQSVKSPWRALRNMVAGARGGKAIGKPIAQNVTEEEGRSIMSRVLQLLGGKKTRIIDPNEIGTAKGVTLDPFGSDMANVPKNVVGRSPVETAFGSPDKFVESTLFHGAIPPSMDIKPVRDAVRMSLFERTTDIGRRAWLTRMRDLGKEMGIPDEVMANVSNEGAAFDTLVSKQLGGDYLLKLRRGKQGQGLLQRDAVQESYRNTYLGDHFAQRKLPLDMREQGRLEALLERANGRQAPDDTRSIMDILLRRKVVKIPNEMRVTVIDGKPVAYATYNKGFGTHYGFNVFGGRSRQLREAERYVGEQFAKLPPEQRRGLFGPDIGFSGGKPFMIEANPMQGGVLDELSGSFSSPKAIYAILAGLKGRLPAHLRAAQAAYVTPGALGTAWTGKDIVQRHSAQKEPVVV